MRRPKSLVRTEGYGFVGRWNDMTLGWFLPSHLSGHGRRFTEGPRVHDANRGNSAYLCKITVEQVFAKNGRPIVRKFK